MQFPEKYIKKGEFVLHSGEKTQIFYDVNALLTDSGYALEIIKKIPKGNHYVGIATAGAVLAFGASLQRLSPFSMIHDGKLKGIAPDDGWILIDDVTTTESSLRQAIRLVRSKPGKIFVVVDRRKEKRLNLESVFEV